MKGKILILVLLVLSGIINAQNVTLKGRVVDTKNGNAVQDAAVFISHNYMVYTNNEGYYTIKEIPAGSYNVKISRLGYKAVSVPVIIGANTSQKDFQLDPSPIELDEVIVSTDRSDKFLRYSPFSELLVGKEKIESKSFQSLSEALQEEAGVSLLRDGAWGTEVSIRGLNRENVVTLIDGNRISTSTDVAARLSMININDIDRVEIIKGASSSIYGSGATGGIVNVITKAPKQYDRFTLSGNITTGFNSVNNMSALSGSIFTGSSIWSTKFSGSYRKAQNIQTPSGELPNSQFEDYSFTGALDVRPFDNNLLKVDYQLFKALNVGIPGGSVFPSNAKVSYPDEKRESISAGYEIQNISKVFYKLSARYSYQDIDRDVENIPYTVQNVAASGTTPAKRVSVLKITPGAKHKSNNIQLQGNLLLAEKNNLIVGVDYWDRAYTGHREKYQLIEVLNSLGNVVSTTNKIIEEKPLPDSKFKSLGVFVQDDAELIKDKLTLTLGARFDRINVTGDKTLNPIYESTNGVINYAPSTQKVLWNEIDANNNSYSGNIGLKYSLTPSLDLTLGAGLSFRSPSLEERFQYIDQGSYVRVGNPDLNPEKGKSADLGLRYYSSGVKVVASVFINYFNDLVTELPGTFEGRSAYIKTNIGEARMYGFDARADYVIFNDMVFHLTVSYVKGDDITVNGDLPEIPPLNGSVGLKFKLIDILSADFTTVVYSAQNNVAVGEQTTPGYATFNLYLESGSFNLRPLDFRISAGIENIFDKEYRNHLSTTRGYLTTEPGRNIFIKLITNW
jgi:hemoglobin/transferrin/lactoferrin receptor protein